MSHKLIDGYEKAYNDNIPLVDVVMIWLFIEKDENFISYEISNKKKQIEMGEYRMANPPKDICAS
jgi:hypothetical protein